MARVRFCFKVWLHALFAEPLCIFENACHEKQTYAMCGSSQIDDRYDADGDPDRQLGSKSNDSHDTKMRGSQKLGLTGMSLLLQCHP